MVELVYKVPEIYRIFIPLPKNPLKSLNCYVIKSKNRNLLIDTGFNRIECLEALREGIKKLELDMEKTDVFLSHLHSDHCGLINKIATEKSKIYMSKIDYDYLYKNLEGSNWGKIEKKFLEEGFPKEISEELKKSNQAKIFAPDKIFKALLIEDRDVLKLGEIELKSILTSGHTPGHLCLYMEKEKILFSGDHILFDITPNITFWLGVEDSLKEYTDSLKKIRELKIFKTFPGHRKGENSPYERIEEILEHHKLRLEDTMKVIESEEKLSAYEVASRMKWNMRSKKWSEFPNNQKWFAVGETIAHLDYLINRNKIKKSRNKEKDIYEYFLSK